MTHVDPIEQAAALRADTQQLLAAAPYDAGDAAPRRHIPLTPPTPDEQIRALTAELNRHHTALRELEGERDDLRIQLAEVTANGDHLRERLTNARRHINGLEADLRTAQRDNRELTAELGQTRADHAAALELLTVYSDAHERIDRARANYATRPRQNAAEPPHSTSGSAEAHDGAAEAHRGAEAADDDELDAADLADAMEHAESVRIDSRDVIWRPVGGGWRHPIYGTFTPARLEDEFGPTRDALLLDIEQDDEQDVDQAERDATLAQEPPTPGAVAVTDAEHADLLGGALNLTRRKLAASEDLADRLAAALTDITRQMYEKGHPGEPCLRSSWIRVSEVERWRALLAEHAARSAACPTCSGPVRETVGMVCQTCGTDYATREG